MEKNTETSLLGTAQQNWTAGEVQNSDLGVRLESTRRVSRWFRAFGQISWQHRDFRASEHLDGPLLGIAGRGTWIASPTVHGDSMDRTGFRDGDVVAIRATPEAKNGDVVVARFGDEVTLKRFVRLDERHVELRPDSHNPEHETKRIDLAKHILHIDGVAVGALIGRLGNACR